MVPRVDIEAVEQGLSLIHISSDGESASHAAEYHRLRLQTTEKQYNNQKFTVFHYFGLIFACAGNRNGIGVKELAFSRSRKKYLLP